MLHMSESFLEAIHNRIILFDGAMGTEIQKLNLHPQDFPKNHDGFNDGLVLSKPECIKQIHRNYLNAGADCIETNTFGSSKLKLDEYGFGKQTVALNKQATRIARDVCNEFTDRPRYVIGSIGPSGFLPSSNDPDLGQKPLEEIIGSFQLQVEGLIVGGVDALLIETSQDILEVKLVIEACKRTMLTLGKKVPIIANVTLDQYGKMLLGTNVQSAFTTVSDMGIDVFGLNCSTGPDEMTPSVNWLNEQDDLPILVIPNAGMPYNDAGKAIYKMTPDELAIKLENFIVKFQKIKIIGGCCGTTPDHIAKLRKMLDQYQKK